MSKPTEDYYTKPGATRLAEQIVSYWRGRGFYGVTATPYYIAGLDAPHWGVRSNIGARGYPPRERRAWQ